MNLTNAAEFFSYTGKDRTCEALCCSPRENSGCLPTLAGDAKVDSARAAPEPINVVVTMRNLISYITSWSWKGQDQRSDDLLEQCEQLKRQNRDLSLRYSAAEHELATRQDELSELRQQCAALQREKMRPAPPEPTDGQRDQLVAELKSQLKALRETVDALHKQTERAEARSAGLQLLVTEKSNGQEKAEARAQLAKREAERQLERSEQFRAEVHTLQVTHARLVDEHQILQTMYETLEQDAVAAIEQNEREIAALKARIEDLNSADEISSRTARAE